MYLFPSTSNMLGWIEAYKWVPAKDIEIVVLQFYAYLLSAVLLWGYYLKK